MIGGFGVVLLYMLGIIMIISEVFVPAFGALGLLGLVTFGFAIYLAAQFSSTAAIIGGLVAVILVPLGVIVSVRNWHRTLVGRMISPPNPKLNEDDRMPVAHMERYVGGYGKTLTPLRPVGICLFGAERVECTADFGMIERGVRIEGIRVVDRTLVVQPIDKQQSTENNSTEDSSAGKA